ncbi:MAG: exonuclease SbcCD subunit D [Oscillospiraceae bacterium]
MDINENSSVKILHCADIHIGAQNYYLRTKAKQRRSEILATLEKIVHICRDENIELLLIAGDMFDSNHVETAAIKQVKHLFAEIPDTRIFIAAGDHDYITSDSPYVNSTWPDNVYVFRSVLEHIDIPEKNVRVWGASLSTPYLENSLIHNVNVPDDGVINIMVMHGEFVSENQSSRYNPITKSALSYSCMDYVALGHMHTSSSIHTAGKTHFAYSGCIESQGFDETGLKGVYTGYVSKGSCNLSFRPVQYRICLTMQVDITGLRTQSEIIDEVYRQMKSVYGEKYTENIYRVTFSGTLHDSSAVDFVQIEKELSENIFFVQVRNYTRPDVDLEELASEMTLKGLFVKKMLAAINSANSIIERNNIEKAMYLGLRAFDGEVNYYEN